MESVTAHADKGVGIKTSLYQVQEEEEQDEGEEQGEEEVGWGGGRASPTSPS